MGQKTHPYGFRLGVIKTWTSKWYEDKQYSTWLHEDLRIKRAVKDYLYNANVASVEVERAANKVKVIVYTARPGMVIGKGGKGIEILKVGNLETAAKGETKFAGVQSFTKNDRPRPKVGAIAVRLAILNVCVQSRVLLGAQSARSFTPMMAGPPKM